MMICKVLKRRTLPLVLANSYKQTTYKHGTLSKIQIKNPFQERGAKIEKQALKKV